MIHRYEVEYDENRLNIARDIGRRFLGIDSNVELVNDSGGGGGANNTKAIAGNGNNDTDGSGDNGNDNNGDAQTTDNKKENTSKEINLNCEKDELVLDVLNDDLIAKVRGRTNSK